MNFKTIAVGLVALVIGATVGVVALQSISAATSNPVSTLVQNLAKKFNASAGDVQGVFDQTKTQLDQQRQQEIKNSLDQAVKDGKITSDQENTILSKLSDIQTKAEAASAAQQDLRSWSNTNNVDLQTILPKGGFGHHGFGFRY